MNALIPPHSPTPQFRASLEAELLRALREDRADRLPTIWRRHRARLRTAATLAVGLVLGVGTQFASAQVQESRQKSELERAKESERQVAALRLMLARATADQQAAAQEVAVTQRRAMVEARLAARMAEAEVVRIDLELAEIRATAKMPRDELWAPLVGERDFVKERLAVVAAAAQQRLAEAEKVAEEANRRMQVEGRIEVSLLEQSRAELAESRLAFNRLAVRLHLREQFHREGLEREEVTRRIEKLEVEMEAQRVQELLQFAQSRLERTRESEKAGTATALDLKRAELAVMERQVELQRLLVRLKAMDKP